jgi:hypothetical protein
MLQKSVVPLLVLTALCGLLSSPAQCQVMANGALPALAPIKAEFGDAPDGFGARYAPPFHTVIGNFPTDLNTTNSRYGLAGGNALSSTAWLGGVVSLEASARDCADPDTIENLIDDDFDDGLVGSLCPFAAVPPYGDPMQVTLTFDVTLSAGATTRYINVLLDQNHDGVWNDATSPFTEWVVQDYPLNNLIPGTTQRVTVGPFLVAATSAGSWMRVSLTDQQVVSVVPVDATGWDGSGTFNDGELEDYLLSHSLGAVLVAEHAEASARAAAASLSIAYAEAEAYVDVIVAACADISANVDAISVSCSSADAAVVSASSSASSASDSAASASIACASASTTALAIASTCVTCECASACASAGASAQSAAAACAAAVSSASASADAAAGAVAVAQASADACALAFAHADASATACAAAHASAYAKAQALAISLAEAQAHADAAADALAAAVAAACGGKTAVAAAAAVTASAEAEAAVSVLTAALAAVKVAVSANAAVAVWVDVAVRAVTFAATSAQAAAGAATFAATSATAAASADSGAAAVAISLSQAFASAQASCTSSCQAEECCDFCVAAQADALACEVTTVPTTEATPVGEQPAGTTSF